MNSSSSATFTVPPSDLALSPVTFQIFGEHGYPLSISIPLSRVVPNAPSLVEITGALPNYSQFCLFSPLKVKIMRDGDDAYVASVESVPVLGYGKTAADALSDLLESLGGAWVGLKDRPDYELTKDAIDLRNFLEYRFTPKITCDA